jgi:hypothetical protein
VCRGLQKNTGLTMACRDLQKRTVLTINGNKLFAQHKWNRNLYNVRGIASGNSKIYAAVNNAVVVFKYVCNVPIHM